MFLTIKSRVLDRAFTFFKPPGYNYIYDSSYLPGTSGKKLCRNGSYMGHTLMARDEKFESVCRQWLRQYIKNNRES